MVATLESLASSDYRDFEVIVVDNNTPDAELWTPVAEAVDSLGPRFRFVHIDRLAGAKAGALNVALSLADERTTHVAVVDADYQVDPEFLGEAVQAVLANRVDYVQFPQAYRRVGPHARGVELELGDYFASFAGGVGRAGSMLPTGTLSLFSADALRAVGGWPTQTITEDAEIGVRLQASGRRGLWLAQTRGRGLLPVDFDGIRKQRARWAAGNLQVLRRMHRYRRRNLSPGDQLNLIAQLTSWISLIFPAALALLAVGFVPSLPLAGAIGVLAGGVICTSAVLTSTRLLLLSGAGVNVLVRIEALATKAALTWTSATAWAPALLPGPLEFHRTAKSIVATRAGGQFALLAVSLVFVALVAQFAMRQQILEAMACGVLASAWPCSRLVDRNLRRAAAMNPELS